MAAQQRELFVTRLWQFALPELHKHHAEWLTTIGRLRDKDPRAEVNTRSLRGGWKSGWRLLAHRSFAPLEQAARRCFTEVFEQFELPANLAFNLHGEANWSERHSYNVQHGHENCLLTGVYYLQVPEQSGDIIFHEPRLGAKYSPLQSPCTMASKPVAITPKPGELYIFPAWLEHSVSQSHSDEDRISIPINAVRRG